MKHDSSKCIVLWVVMQERGGRLEVDNGTEDKPHNHRDSSRVSRFDLGFNSLKGRKTH